MSVVPGLPTINSESAFQMLPGSKLLRSLNESPLPSGISYTNIYNYIDPLVWPPAYARLPYPEANNILIKKIGHLQPLYDVQELEIILRSLLVEEEDDRKRGLLILRDQDVIEERYLSGMEKEYGEFVTSSD